MDKVWDETLLQHFEHPSDYFGHPSEPSKGARRNISGRLALLIFEAYDLYSAKGPILDS